jgi:hypothetical protein
MNEQHICEACRKCDADQSVHSDGTITLYCQRCGWESGPRVIPAAKKERWTRAQREERAERVPPPKKRRA